MLYVIDGHNLIGKLPGLSLDMLDDEAALIKRLQTYTGAQRQRGRKVTIEVFFDRAALGHAGVQNHGAVHAHFVQFPLIADEAIRRYLVKLGGAVRNVTVVSSDRQVQTNARALHAQVLPSETFADELAALPPAADDANGPTGKESRNIDQWLELFGVDPNEADRPIEIKREKPARKGQGSEKKKPKPGDASRPRQGFEKKP